VYERLRNLLGTLGLIADDKIPSPALLARTECFEVASMPFRRRMRAERQHIVQSLSLHVEPDPELSELSEWDQLVSTTLGTDVTQLSAWARVRAHVGYLPLYIFVRKEGQLVGGAQLLYRKVLRMGHIGYVPYGPLTRVRE
jgi:hypothetical protein